MVSREAAPAKRPTVPPGTDARARQRDLTRATELGYQEQRIQFLRAYDRITFLDYDRLLTETMTELNLLYAKWDKQPGDAGAQFRQIVRRRLDDNLPNVREEFFKKYGKPKNTATMPKGYGPTYRQIQERELLYERLKTLGAWAVGFLVLALIWGILSSAKPRKKEEPAPVVSTNYGTAAYARQWTDILDSDYPFRGVFFGKSSHPDIGPDAWEGDYGAPLLSLPEAHTLIVAPTRTGKGTRVLVPTLLRYIGSMIVLDVKGELAAITGKARKNIMIDVPFFTMVLNPWGVLADRYRAMGIPAARYNPLDILERDDPNAVAIAQTLASTILPPPPGEKDRFWQGNAANILTAVLLFLTDQPGETKTLARAREITSLPRKRFTDDYMVRMAASEGFGGAIRELISPFLDLAQETYSGIMANLAEGMKFLSDPQVKAATASSTFSMKDLIDLPVTLYIVIPPERLDTQRTWLRLLIAAATSTYKMTPMEGRPAHRTMFMIDELPALGRMPDLPRDLATMAGYGLDHVLAVQGLDQLRDVYREAAGTILGNCAFKWFCNVKDLDSAKYLSESLGKKTVVTVGRSESAGSGPSGQTAGESVTQGETGRNLLNPDEILNLGRDVAIVLNPLDKPHYVRTVDYWRMPAVFGSFRDTHPWLYWDPPLRYDPNPYISARANRAMTAPPAS